jgi:serine/threonine protein phosphatase PrpC
MFSEKFKTKDENNNLKYGLCSMKGFRDSMEDAHCSLLSLPIEDLENWSFFGVFDGHGGIEISNYVSKELINSILNADKELFELLSSNNEIASSLYENRLIQAIINGFYNIDDEMRKLRVRTNDPGSTVVACLITPTQIYLINLGDSRGFIVSNNQIKITTQDHKSENETEKERILNAGGSVKLRGKNYNGKEIYDAKSSEGFRLSMSRALGDYRLKCNPDKQKCEQILIAKPEIYVYERSIEKDEYLVLACDGIWDVIENEGLKHYIDYSLSIKNDLEEICVDILDMCSFKVNIYLF